ncbi:glutelin type-B 5-like isoform X1 [Carex littledalei]|uniref:Glutelin type-B 5-like isoform X1 n=1 Tax=Carex littledalei TaxID=544730 RepID=A0A833RJK0_9POAL|nr:glutelin type-B 5-like isoform X1 [Carex littledalei]
MATSTFFLSFSLCLSVLLHGCAAQFGVGGQSPWHSSRGLGIDQRACRFERLEALEPSRRVKHEAGVTEYYDENNEQLRCAGLSARRRIIEPRGLRLPAYSNAPSLVYIKQGRCLMGIVYPGCPESYQSFQQQFEQSRQEVQAQGQRPRDEHQKVQRIREGDVVALPAGVTHWFYNDGDVPVVAVTVSDISNSANQLEPRRREFLLAGRHQRGGQSYETEQQSGNILTGFDTRFLAEALGVNQELARRLQSQTDDRGEIVHVPQGLQLLRPSRIQEEQQQQQEEEFSGERYHAEWRGNYSSNGLDENFCTMRIRENINDPSRADIYNPRSGRITILNNQKLPILNNVQMSANRVVLRRNSVLAPHWNINAHSLIYVTGGSGRVQIVNHQGRTVFDGQLRQRQILLIPQNYAVLKRAYQDQFEYVSFKTNPNAMVSKITGKESIIGALPLDVLRASYRLTIEQARRLKNSRREEMALFAPRFQRSASEEESKYDQEFQGNPDVTITQVVN